MRSVELGADESLVLSDTLSATEPRLLGGVKPTRRPGAGFQVIGMVEEPMCELVGLSLASDPGIPASAFGDVWVSFRLRDTPYSMNLNSSNGNTEVLTDSEDLVRVIRACSSPMWCAGMAGDADAGAWGAPRGGLNAAVVEFRVSRPRPSIDAGLRKPIDQWACALNAVTARGCRSHPGRGV